MSKGTANSAQVIDPSGGHSSLPESSRNTLVNATQRTEKREREGNGRLKEKMNWGKKRPLIIVQSRVQLGDNVHRHNNVNNKYQSTKEL